MFGEEAEEYADEKYGTIETEEKMFCRIDWQRGAEFGYNKANEWHYVKDGDLPKDDNRIVLCICGNGYIDGKVNYILKLLTRKEFSLFQPVYRWKEIVLPELPIF